MKDKPSVNTADLYALRTFLKVSTRNEPKMEHPILGGKRYLFTPVREEAISKDTAGNASFLLRRQQVFIQFYYDVLEFSYRSGKIEIKEGEFKDDSDKEMAKKIIDTLRGRCYSAAISNLDDILKEE